MDLKRVNIFPMKIAKGRLEEIFLDGSIRITCPPELTPAPGQYLLAHLDGSDAPLPVPLFSSLILPQSGFRSAPPVPVSWRPGDLLSLRGPIGRGFLLPTSVKKTALIAFDQSPARLQGMISIALKQNAEIVVVCGTPTEDLPEVVEVQPLKAMLDVLQWADYAAMDVSRENLDRLREMLAGKEQVTAKIDAQVLVRAPMPCGALAECGVCALPLHHDWKMICKDGPVFEWQEVV